jgi:hypothetical protein
VKQTRYCLLPQITQRFLLTLVLWVILPVTLLAQTAVYRINAGGPALTNSIGSFAVDQFFSGGSAATYSANIAGTNEPQLYRSERYGNFSYALPVSNGQYTVVLHFAELTWTRSGQRVFDVMAEGKKVLPNYDILRKVGALTATTETLLVTVTDGVLNLAFNNAKGDLPKVSAIQVLSSAASPPVCNVAAPVVTAVAYCVSSTSALLSSQVTLNSGATLLIYSSASQGVPIADFRPSTSTAGSTTYYVTQTLNSCESPRAAIVVNVAATPNAPVTTNASYCLGAQASLLSSNVTLSSGAALRLYASATSTTALADFRPPTAAIGTTTYYAAQVVGNCESGRTPFSVSILDKPGKPLVSTPVTYVQGAASSPLSNSVTLAAGGSLRLYDVPSGGTALPATFQPPTGTVGNTTYYAAQVVNSCESEREVLVVTITAPAITPTPTPAPNGKLQNFIVGDSHDDGYLTSGGQATAWASQRFATLNPAMVSAPVIIAVTGETLLQQYNRVKNELLPAIDMVNFRGAHIDLGAGTNDIGLGATDQDVKARRIAIIQLIRQWQAAHNNFPITIAVLSMTKNGKPDQGVSIETNWQYSKAANDDWLANYKSYGADYYSNYSADVRLTDPTNTAYFNVDRLHCNDAGHAVKAELNKPILLAAYAGTPLAPAANYVATSTGGDTTPAPAPTPSSGSYTITATYTALPASRTATYALLKYNKRIGLQLTDDDGGKVDITCIPQVLNGGRAANGVTYPGITYTDGAGGNLHPSFTYAVSTLINGLPGRDGPSNDAYATWAELQTLKPYRNISFSNHSSNHGPDNPGAQVIDADATLGQKLGVIPRTVTVPGGFAGFVAATLADPKKLAVISQGYGSNGESADGHASEIQWLDKVSVPYTPPTILILSRYFINQDWDAGIRAWVDDKFQLATNEYNAGRRVMLSAFDHFPNAQTANLAAFYAYVQHHPLNVGGDNVWFASLQEFAEYEEVKRKCPISAPAVSGTTLTWTVDKSALPTYSLYQDASLLLPTTGLQRVTVSGSDSYSVNLATGLVNIAKLNVPTLATQTNALVASTSAVARGSAAVVGAAPDVEQKGMAADSEMKIYPNPFSAEATVAFTLPAAQVYSVNLYDAKGTLVKVIASGAGQAGARYSYRIGSHGLADGMYLVRLTVGNSSKMFPLSLNR